MRRRNQRFPQTSCIGILMKLRSACGAALFCVPASPHAVANATAKRAALSTRFASAGIGISPGQALRLASLRGGAVGTLLARTSRLSGSSGECRELPRRARSCLCSCPALLALAAASLTDPFILAPASLRVSSVPPFADKKRQLVAELPCRSLMKRKIASKKILRTQ